MQRKAFSRNDLLDLRNKMHKEQVNQLEKFGVMDHECLINKAPDRSILDIFRDRKKTETIPNSETLRFILKEHERWLLGEEGERADLSMMNLKGVNFDGVDLSRAIIRDSDLECASMKGAILDGAIIYHCDMKFVNLSGAVIRGADMRRTNLTCSSLLGVRALNVKLTPLQRTIYTELTEETALRRATRTVIDKFRALG